MSAEVNKRVGKQLARAYIAAGRRVGCTTIVARLEASGLAPCDLATPHGPAALAAIVAMLDNGTSYPWPGPPAPRHWRKALNAALRRLRRASSGGSRSR